LAALIALVPTYLSLRATNDQLQLAEQGQLIDRYNAAITNLGSGSIDVRLGGIYALQRLMHDSPPDQPTIVAVLCAFVRDRSPLKQVGPGASVSKRSGLPPSDIQAALTVVGARDPRNDGRTTVIYLKLAGLTYVSFTDAHLARANFAWADLSWADFTGANLAGADFSNANLSSVNFGYANLAGANFTNANLTGANLQNANLAGADLAGATGANLYGAFR
jgi:hypothetical protein